jgi:hypothetical protein
MVSVVCIANFDMITSTGIPNLVQRDLPSSPTQIDEGSLRLYVQKYVLNFYLIIIVGYDHESWFMWN